MARSFTKLTRPAMRKLKPGESIMEQGIRFERQANGDGVFTVNIMVDGQRIHRTIGRESDEVTRTQAEEFIEKARRDAREGRLSLPKGRKVPLSFPEAAKQYLTRLEQEGGNDLEQKERRLRLHLTPFFESRTLNAVSNFDVERYKKSRVTAGAKPGSVNRELATLSHLFTKSLEWRWIDRRPAQIKRLEEDNGRIIFLSVEQANRLLAVAMADRNPQLYPFVRIALATAMRQGEILSIQLANIDVGKRTIYIPFAKNGPRVQPITTELALYLDESAEALSQGTKWLFPSKTSTVGHTVDIRKPFVRAVEAAGLDAEQVVRHTLRHTAVSHLVQAGVDLPTVKRISGHRSLVNVERYAHQDGLHIQSAMDRLEARYAGTGTQDLHK